MQQHLTKNSPTTSWPGCLSNQFFVAARLSCLVEKEARRLLILSTQIFNKIGKVTFGRAALLQFTHKIPDELRRLDEDATGSTHWALGSALRWLGVSALSFADTLWGA